MKTTVAALGFAIFLLGISFLKVLTNVIEGKPITLPILCFGTIATIVALLLPAAIPIVAKPPAEQESSVQIAEAPQTPDAPPLDPAREGHLQYYCWELLDHLTAVNGFAELLLESVPSTSPFRPELLDLKEAGYRSLLSTMAMQWTTGMRQPGARVTALNHAILDLQPQLEDILPPGTALKLDLDPQSGLISHDRELLQLLITLLVLSSSAPSIRISSKPGGITIQGAGSPRLSGLVEMWQKLGGHLDKSGDTAALTASIVRDPASMGQ
ncbi:MAG: hypothetical protein IT168_32145 [Bryobacterales bacterium]|nr:hypothetical protein [Bryobacterales bacterium]